ncbi:MAG: substrate-binding domain-containing protein [Armatimonadetes bacterium]|nr:substrate-binding domain-containing protein [Armatimonadota bacterium]
MRRSFVLALFATLALAGCSGGGEGTARDGGGGGSMAGGKTVQVYLLPKQKGVPYFTSCSEGAEEAAKELGGVEVHYDGPTDGSPEKAAAMIQKWALKGADVIAVSVNDPAVLGPALKEARDKGVKVITWDADADASSRDYFVNQATAEQIGFGLVDTMAKDIGEAGGDVAIVTARLTAANQNEWMKHMKVRLEKYPNLKLVATKASNEDQKLAFEVTTDLMKAYPNLKGVFAISSVAFPGAAEAVKQAGKAGQVMVTGLSTPNDMRAFVKDGTVKSVLLWNTKDLGFLTVEVAKALATGELKPGATEFDSKRLGKRAVKGDNVLLGDPMVFTKENIDRFQF